MLRLLSLPAVLDCILAWPRQTFLFFCIFRCRFTKHVLDMRCSAFRGDHFLKQRYPFSWDFFLKTGLGSTLEVTSRSWWLLLLLSHPASLFHHRFIESFASTAERSNFIWTSLCKLLIEQTSICDAFHIVKVSYGPWLVISILLKLMLRFRDSFFAKYSIPHHHAFDLALEPRQVFVCDFLLTSRPSSVDLGKHHFI